MPAKECCTVGNTEIIDEQKRLVRCKVCGSEEVFDEKSFKTLKEMLKLIAKAEQLLKEAKEI